MARRKSTEDKISQKRALWVERTASVFGISQAEAVLLLGQTKRQSVRINPLRDDPQEILAELRKLGWQGEQYDWISNGYTVESSLEPIRDSQLVVQGKVFIQNAASWLPVLALDPKPGELILDMCAAPGGKTSHIAAATQNQAKVTANDNSRGRLAKLQSNLDRLGVENVQTTLFDATQLVRKLEGQQFDKILLDAPCSGEGLRNINSNADVLSWSVANIKRLQQLQKRLVVQAWQLLKPGGTLVYSTCTTAPEENESVVDYLLRKNTDKHAAPINITPPGRIQPLKEWQTRTYNKQIPQTVRLKPTEYTESFFVAKLIKLRDSIK